MGSNRCREDGVKPLLVITVTAIRKAGSCFGETTALRRGLHTTTRRGHAADVAVAAAQSRGDNSRLLTRLRIGTGDRDSAGKRQILLAAKSTPRAYLMRVPQSTRRTRGRARRYAAGPSRLSGCWGTWMSAPCLRKSASAASVTRRSQARQWRNRRTMSCSPPGPLRSGSPARTGSPERLPSRSEAP